MMTANACKAAGLEFAAVHDSYWTHACELPKMNVILRDEFIRLHECPSCRPHGAGPRRLCAAGLHCPAASHWPRASRGVRDGRRVLKAWRLGERAYHRAGEDAGDGEPGPGGERGDGARGRGRRGLLDGHLRALVGVRYQEKGASVSVPRQP